MKRHTIILAALVTLGACGISLATAPVGIDDASSTAPDGTRTLRQSVIVAAPLAAVWAAFTTTDGYRGWAVPVADIDFRVGGIIEASYVTTAKLGDADNIRNEIVAYAPQRMFAIRNRAAPRDAPFDVPTFQSLHTVVLFDGLADGRTRVSIVQPGYRSGAAYSTLWKFFEWGNGATLAALRDRFVNGPTDWSKPRS